jgi:hypothetical protein
MTTLSMNDDFANQELSIEELEAITAGSLWGWIKHEASAIGHWAESPSGRATLLNVGINIIRWIW